MNTSRPSLLSPSRPFALTSASIASTSASMRAFTSALCGFTLVALASCAGSGGDCAAADECPPDAVCEEGTCVRIIAGEGEGEAGEGEGEAGEGEGEAGEGEGEAGEGEGEAGEGEGEGEGEPVCSLADGSLSVSDLPVVAGLPVQTLVANSSTGDLTVSTAGTVVEGVRTWDFSGALEGDADFEIEATFTGDKWYAAEFIAETPIDASGFGAYAAPLSAEIDAVFRRTVDRLVLLGIASVEEDTTLITYDPPILVLEYPLAVGTTFSSESTGSGTLQGNPFYVSTDEYTTTVDAEGEVITGAGTFPVFRMRVDQSVFVGVFGVTKIQYVWLTPCLGVVAHVDSEDGEDDPDFTTATRVQRVAAPGGE